MDTDSLSLLKSTLLVSVIGYFFYRVVMAIQHWRSYVKLFNDMPGEKDFHWIYGTIHKYPGDNEAGIEYTLEEMKKYPRFTRDWAGPFMPVITFHHPDLVRIVLRSSAPKPRGHLLLSSYEMGIGWLGEGLLIANGSRWARSRHLITPAFHFDILKSYIVIKNKATDILLSKLQTSAEQKKSFEVFQYTSMCLFDIILQCAFAEERNCQIKENDPFLRTVNELVGLWSKRVLMPWLYIDVVFRMSSVGRRWKKLCDAAHNLSEDLINKRRKTLEEKQKTSQTEPEGNPDKKRMMSFVDILLTARDEEGRGMTPLEIRNEADTFLFEGYDTTTSALSWTLYSLARLPEHQTRVQEEVDAILNGRSSDHLKWEDLSRLPYTTACIKEGLRNYAAVPAIERQCVEPLNVDGHMIPAGTVLRIYIWALHHNEAVWDRPNDYLPERFLGDNAIKMDPFQYVPFSAGPRNCIGQNFAMHELKIIVARICHRFTLTLDPNHEVLRTPLATFKAEKDIKVFATPRRH